MSKKFRKRSVIDYKISEAELRGRGIDRHYEPEGNTSDISLYIPTTKKEEQQNVPRKVQKATNEVSNGIVNDFLVEEFLLKAEQCDALLHERVEQLLEEAKREDEKN